MLDRSNHTHQINLWIALSKFEPTFSDTLGQNGYECDVIEERLYLHGQDGERTIHPDVVLSTTSEDHALIVDCKSESLSEDQFERYLMLEGGEEQLVTQGLVDGVSIDNLSEDTTISSFTDLSGPEIPDGIAFIHFKTSPSSGLSIWNTNEHEFEKESLNEIFPINVDPTHPLPTSYYPFDIYEADKEAMVSTVLTSIISLAMREGDFSIEDILHTSHPYWDKLGSDKQRQIRERVEIIFGELRRAGLEDYLERIAGTEGQEWQRISKTIQAVHDKTDYYVDRVMDNLPQARLDHHAWSAESTVSEGAEAGED